MACLRACCYWLSIRCCSKCGQRRQKRMMGKYAYDETEQTDAGSQSMSDATEILPHLYLGGLGNRNTWFLTEKNITSIINASNMDPKKITGCSQPYDIEELVVPLWDADISNIHRFFEKAGEMIDKTEKTKGAILVHCAAGISRSTTLVLAYLMKYKNMPLKDAHKLVKSKRKVIKPNLGFWAQLVEFEKELFGENSVHMIEETPVIDSTTKVKSWCCLTSCAQAQPNENTRLIPDIYSIHIKV